ncbi:MAG: sulfatase-like hydrolase/transferase [Planctomycetota bacterium]
MQQRRAATLLSLGLLAVASSAVAQQDAQQDAQQNARPPNVVVILVDDLGYVDLSFLGSPDMRTPRIDSLAQAGTYFTSAYATCAVCSPSRAALLTGRYQQRFGHEFNLPHRPNRGWGLPSSETTLAHALGNAGYRTIAVGKWHLGLTDNFHPLERGFDHFYGFLLGGRSYFPQPDGKGRLHKRLQRDREPIEHEDFGYLTDELGKEAAKYIERFHDVPFFLYLSFSAVHGPLQAPGSRAPAGEDAGQKRSTLVEMTASLDRAVGSVLDALDAHELTQNTLVFFLSDHGGALVNESDNGPLRGEKGTYFEGGVRIPYILRWPGVAPAGARFEGTVSTLDLVPTVLGAAGLPSELDGVDLRPYLTGEREGSPHDVLYWRFGNLWGIRQDDWKVVQEEEGAPLLFHLGRDLGESTDLAAEEPGQLAKLIRTWETWSATMRPGRWRKYTTLKDD